MSNNIQFRRGSKQDYDAIKASGTDLHDIYLVGGSQHPNIITTTGEDGQTTSTEETKPLSMFVGDEQVQELIPNEITVTVGNAPGYAQGSTIPAGTPISEIIFNLLSKEINPKAATKPGASVAFASTAPSGLKYVGSTVNIPKVTLSATGGTFTSNWSGTPSQPTPSFDKSGYKIAITSEAGFDGYPTEDQTGTQIAQTAATVKAGSNKRTFGGSYSYTAPSNSPITNLKNAYTGADATWTAGTASVPSNGLKTVTVTGVYRIYTNGKYVAGNGPGNDGSITGYDVVQYEPTSILDTYTVGGNLEFKVCYKKLHDDSETRILHLPINMQLVSQNTWGVSAHDSDAYFEFVGETTDHENTDGIKYNVFKWTSNNGSDKYGDNTVLFKVKVTSSDPYASQKTNN